MSRWRTTAATAVAIALLASSFASAMIVPAIVAGQSVDQRITETKPDGGAVLWDAEDEAGGNWTIDLAAYHDSSDLTVINFKVMEGDNPDPGNDPTIYQYSASGYEWVNTTWGDGSNDEPPPELHNNEIGRAHV